MISAVGIKLARPSYIMCQSLGQYDLYFMDQEWVGRGWGVAQLVECLSSTHKALALIPNTIYLNPSIQKFGIILDLRR